MRTFFIIFRVHKICILILLLLASSCMDSYEMKVTYDNINHVIIEENKHIIKEVEVKFRSDTDNCTTSYSKRLGVNGMSSINLEKPDSSVYNIYDKIGCKFIKGNSYQVVVRILGNNDTLKIVW